MFIIIFQFQHWEFLPCSKWSERKREWKRTLRNIWVFYCYSWEMTWKWLIIYIYLPLSSIDLFSVFFSLPRKFVEVSGIYKQFRTQNFFHETNFFFDFIPSWNVQSNVTKFTRKWNLLRMLSFACRLTYFIKCIISNAFNAKYSRYYEKRMWNYTFIPYVKLFKHSFNEHCMRRQNRSRMRSFVCVCVEAKQSIV